MAEKRGIDRCVLKLVNAYQWGVYSEVEAEDFERKNATGGVSITKSDDSETIKVEETDTGEAKISNPVTFGKHIDKDWSKVPQDYVEWCAGSSKVDWQRDQANEELQRRTNPTKKSGGMSEQDRVESSNSYADKDDMPN